MKIRNTILVVGLMAMGGAMWAGCGGNPCQDLQDAYNAAASAKNCKGLLPKITINTSNCPSDDASVKALECETAAYKEIKDCKTDLTKAATALAKCGG